MTYQKYKACVKLMRLDKPIGSLLLLWPTLSAIWIAAQGKPDSKIVIIFALGVVVMRSAGCVINDYADRKVDGLVTRTRNRPLVTGELAAKDALWLFAILGVIAFVLVIQLNILTISMSVVGLFLAATYPFMKRYTHLPQVYLGAAFAWAIPMAFAAQTNAVPMVAWLLFIANILWITAYDTYYAMADRKDDVKAGIKSTAILFAKDDKVIIAILQICFLIIMILAGDQLDMTISYYLAIIFAFLLFVYQQKITGNREPAQCMHAFFNNNWVGAVLFAGVVIHYLM